MKKRTINKRTRRMNVRGTFKRVNRKRMGCCQKK